MASEIIQSDEKGLSRAARTLREGGLVAFPTETVYGLGADACSGDSVAKIYEMKQRPQFNPLIMHAPSLDAAMTLGKFNSAARACAKSFWAVGSKGGLTLVVPKSDDCPISSLALAGGETIALRVPSHPIALALLRESGLFLAAPSANPSGGLSPTTAAHVAQSFADKSLLILDGGQAQLGLESTIVACLPSGNVLLRAGSLESAKIESVLGAPLKMMADEGKIKLSAGRLPSHYAPRATLRLNANAPVSGEGFLGFGAMKTEFNLSENSDLAEAAKNFFAFLHQLDSLYGKIAVAPIPQEGLGIALNDRLLRASAPRN